MILHPSDKLQIAYGDFDKIVCAEIRNPETNPRLYAIVTSYLIHGPCGNMNPNCVCMKDKICSKIFLKEIANFTISTNNSFPLYRRRNKYKLIKRDAAGHTLYTLNYSWVVPYNPYLALKYNANISVEICGKISAVKYLYKCIKVEIKQV